MTKKFLMLFVFSILFMACSNTTINITKPSKNRQSAVNPTERIKILDGEVFLMGWNERLCYYHPNDSTEGIWEAEPEPRNQNWIYPLNNTRCLNMNTQQEFIWEYGRKLYYVPCNYAHCDCHIIDP